MKKVLFAGIAVALLTACSNDDVVLQNNDANAIKFAVTTERNSRAQNVFCQNNLPAGFTVSAAHQGKKYIVNDEIKNQNGKWENTSGLRYWPNADQVTFYGYVNYGTTFTWPTAAATPTFADFKVAEQVADQVDLLYAVKTQGKGTNNNQVVLNFRHALSQIVFNARNENKNLYVEIKGVKLCNVDSKGTYTFPTADTDANLSHPNAEGEEIENSRGSWSEALTDLTSYSVVFDNAIPVKGILGTKDAVDLTTVPKGSNPEFTSNAMLLIPQTTTAINAGTEAAVTEKATNSYFLLNCKICNVADGSGVASSDDVILWPKDTEVTYAEILIPVGFTWEEGYKYTYTFVFGKGNGGYDPENPGDDPVLVPITFDVKVDEFKEVDSIDIESKIPGSNDNPEAGA